MPLDSAARQCLSLLHSSTSRTTRIACPSSLRKHARRCTRPSRLLKHSLPNIIRLPVSQLSESEGIPSGSHAQHTSSSRHSPINPINLKSSDAIDHLRRIFPPLEFPPDVAQRMTTHVSWKRGVEGHNGRLGFVGRRVLHTYLLLFLHECTLSPRSHTPSKKAPIPPSGRLRPSTFSAGGPIAPLTESYDDMSEKLLNTYTLGEHVGAAWELERIMRWTPAIAELDVLQAQSPNTLLRSSGLYKVRGATVEGVVGGIFHQFGGSIAHRVFHTRILPHIYHLGLPLSLHPKVKEACERLGGDGDLTEPEPVRKASEQDESDGSQQNVRNDSFEADRPRRRDSGLAGDVEYVKVGDEQRTKERRRMGFVG